MPKMFVVQTCPPKYFSSLPKAKACAQSFFEQTGSIVGIVEQAALVVAVMKKKPMSQKTVNAAIDRIYGKYCSGMQIPVMKIGGLFKMAGPMIVAGELEAAIGAAMVAYVEKAGTS